MALAHGFQRGADDFVGVHEPLIGQHWFDHHFGAIAKRLHDLFVFDVGHQFQMFGIGFWVDCFHEGRHGQPFGGDIGDHAFARLETIQPAVFFGHHVHRRN